MLCNGNVFDLCWSDGVLAKARAFTDQLPRAGEQLSSLSATTESLDPETFRNYEVGAKWDINPALSMTAAAVRRRGSV